MLQISYKYFKDNNISISSEIVNLIVERCRGDRLNLYNEIDKISSLAKSRKKLTAEEILTLTNLAENYSISELADCCLSKNAKKVNKILNENNFSSDECILILRTILYKTKRLLDLKKNYKISNNIDESISSYKPPIFWKDKQIVKNQVLTWKIKDIETLLININYTEINVKKHASNSLKLVLDFLFNTVKFNN